LVFLGKVERIVLSLPIGDLPVEALNAP